MAHSRKATHQRRKVVNNAQNPSSQVDLFKYFDFALVEKRTNELEQLVFDKVIYPCVRQPNVVGAFFPFPLQTGIGKTYAMARTIIRELLHDIKLQLDDSKHQRRTIVYITNSRDNVLEAIHDTREVISNDKLNLGLTDAQKEYLQKELLDLPSKDDQLLKCSDENLEVLTKAYGIEKLFAGFWSYIKMARAGHTLKNDEIAVLIKQQLQQASDLLLTTIQTRTPSKDYLDGLSIKLDNILDIFLPGDSYRREESHVLFMTTLKYMHGFDHAKGKCHISGRNQVNQMLIIDEVDRQNEEILKHLTDITAADRVFTLKNLYLHLKGHKLEQTEQYEPIQTLFDEYFPELEAYYQFWQLGMSFKLAPRTKLEHVRLFVDRSYFTHRNSADGILSVHPDTTILKNVIHVDKEDDEDAVGKETHLTRLINQTDALYNKWISVMWSAVKKYRDFSDEKNDDTAMIAIAVDSILTHYSISEEVRKEIKEAMRTPPPKYGEGSKTDEYHNSGFRFNSYEPVGLAEHTVGSRHYDLPHSPTGLLEQWVRRGTAIIGVSATATSKTCIHNFDIDYLARVLGTHYIALTTDDINLMNTYYNSLRSYSKGVNVAVDFISEDTVLLEKWYRAYIRANGEMEPENMEIGAILGIASDDKRRDFEESWMSRLLKAVVTFAKQPTQRYMVVMLPRHLEGKYTRFYNFLQHVVEAENAVPERKIETYSIAAANLKTGIKYELREALSKVGGPRVIIFTTYISMGAGSNFQYPIPLDEVTSLINVSAIPGLNTMETDIDTMYMEKPTRMLLQGSESVGKQSPRLMLFHQTLSLQERNEISETAVKQEWLKAIFDMKEHDANRLATLYGRTEDYVAAVIKCIEQGVGRTARTPMKKPKIHIMLGDDLIDIIAKDSRNLSTALVSHEYRAIGLKAQSLSRQHCDQTTIEDNTRWNHTKRGAIWITQMLNTFPRMPGLQSKYGVADVDNWQELREVLLKNPVVNDLTTSPDRRKYIPVGELKNRYTYLGSTDVDSGVKFFIGDKEVSMAACRLQVLMQNETVKAHFVANGFATQWELSNYMMNPHMFQRIYQGALGEEAIKALLVKNGWTWNSLPAYVFETYDGLLTKPNHPSVLVDAKHWSPMSLLSTQGSAEFQKLATRRKVVIEKLAEQGIEVSRILYVNALGSTSYSDLVERADDFSILQDGKYISNIATIGALMDEITGATHMSALHKLLRWMEK